MNLPRIVIERTKLGSYIARFEDGTCSGQFGRTPSIALQLWCEHMELWLQSYADKTISATVLAFKLGLTTEQTQALIEAERI